jgi:hypothetical protein
MIDLLLNLEFDCCLCGGNIEIKLKCEGPGLAEGAHVATAVKLKCPTCYGLNELIFEPNSSLILDVRSCQYGRAALEPSLN